MERASWVIWWRTRLVLAASLPPFRRRALPLAIANADTYERQIYDGTMSKEMSKTGVRNRNELDRIYLRKAVRPSLKDYQKNPNWHSDLLQNKVMSHPGPAQHTPHAVLCSHRYLT